MLRSVVRGTAEKFATSIKLSLSVTELPRTRALIYYEEENPFHRGTQTTVLSLAGNSQKIYVVKI